MNDENMSSTKMAFALIDILYEQGIIDQNLYYRIQAKNRAFVKADKEQTDSLP